jgi:hypothetical protein
MSKNPNQKLPKQAGKQAGQSKNSDKKLESSFDQRSDEDLELQPILINKDNTDSESVDGMEYGVEEVQDQENDEGLINTTRKVTFSKFKYLFI